MTLPNVLSAMQSIRGDTTEVLRLIEQIQPSLIGGNVELVQCTDILKNILEVSNAWIEAVPQPARRFGTP